MELSLENLYVDLGLKGYKTSPTPTPHLTGRAASERKERKNFCKQTLWAVR